MKLSEYLIGFLVAYVIFHLVMKPSPIDFPLALMSGASIGFLINTIDSKKD